MSSFCSGTLLSYHGVIVAVNHDGPTASEVNILFPPVTNLWNRK